jgi:hypothetical protein
MMIRIRLHLIILGSGSQTLILRAFPHTWQSGFGFGRPKPEMTHFIR